MYPYHNRIKQRIRNGELIGYRFEKEYPRIGECMVLVFDTAPPLRPIRPHRVPEYMEILANYPELEESDKAQSA